MNILMVTFDYPPSPVWGMGGHVSELETGLRQKGHVIKVITVDRFGLILPSSREIITAPCPHTPINLSQKGCFCKVDDNNCLNLLYKIALERLLQDSFVPDIIHCHGWMVFDIAHQLSRYFNSPVVTTIHFLECQYDSINHHPFLEQLPEILSKEKEMIDKSEQIICVSNFGRNLLLQHYTVGEAKVNMVTHGTSMVVQADKNVLVGKARSNMVFVGRLEEEKGIDILCKVMEEHFNHLTFKIVGTGSQEASLKGRYDGKFIFTGLLPKEKVLDELINADFIIIPSKEEQFGLVAIEGMACGAIPVASNIGGLQQIIMQDQNGFLFDVEHSHNKVEINEVILKECINRAISTPKDELMNIRKRNLDKVKENFSIKAMTSNTLQVYSKSIRRKGI